MLILQWDARSLLANGQELKKYVGDMPRKPDVICIQETWIKPNLDFRLAGYACVRCDREGGQGGGRATFISEDITFREVKIGTELQDVTVEIWAREGEVIVVHFYNP